MGMLDGKVALITGGSRGQGRAHATTCAREGADVIIVDIADQMGTVPYKLATQADLEETVAQVEAYDKRALAIKADGTRQMTGRRIHQKQKPPSTMDRLRKIASSYHCMGQ